MQHNGINVNIVHQLKAATIMTAAVHVPTKIALYPDKKKGLQMLSVTP